MYRAHFVLLSSGLLSLLMTAASCSGDVDSEAGPPDPGDRGGEGGAGPALGGRGADAGGGANAGGAGDEGGGGTAGLGGVSAGAGGSAGSMEKGGSAGTQGGTGGAGMTGAGGGAGASAVGDEPPPGWVRAAVAVGYAGNRALTRDYGVTWTNKTQLAASGGDDDNLLRGVAFGRGKWVAVGWKHLTSEDGATWTVVQRRNACGLMEDIAYGNGVFLGTCGDNAHTSTDGITFSQGARIGSTGGHTYVWFGNGLFVASGDSGASFSSPDGKKWTAMPQKRVWYCENEFRTEGDCGGAAWADGHFLREKYPMGFQRSTDGKSWQPSGAGRGTYRIRFGYAPAQ